MGNGVSDISSEVKEGRHAKGGGVNRLHEGRGRRMDGRRRDGRRRDGMGRRKTPHQYCTMMCRCPGPQTK